MLEPELEALVLSARKAGYAECLADCTGILVEASRLGEAQTILIMLAKRFDLLTKKGASLHA